jgi:serine/threonine-protein kinase
MEETRWRQVQSIFDQVADLPRADQHSAIKELSGADELLDAEVRALLDEDAQPNPLLDQGLIHAAGVALESAHLTSLVRRQVGPYRLLRLLGEGGMGVVYLAERMDIGGQVAIKFLRDAWLSPMRRERFAAEQRSLARLNHPAIARIYDSGSLEDGTPWFVMEYADALPLTEYWKQRRASLREGLRLFRDVCRAVEYAHEHAIIHRDLKPSNILVTKSGEIKLLDFGIAKQMTPDTGSADRTVAGLRLMTPAYAAPEQMTDGAIGVYTDVYALGVILYELLTERLPFDGGIADLDAGALWKIRSAVEKPSQAIQRLPPDRRGSASKGEWADLDLLCLTALRVEPAERYRSVAAMIRDVEALLEGRPLEAHPERFRYRAGKFIRRHRRSLAGTAAVFLLIAATVIFFTNRLARARNAALAEAERTRRIQQFTEDLFEGGDKSAGPSGDLKVTDLLDRGRQQAASLNGDPDVQADMRSTLGGIYQKLGKLDQAEPLLVSALEARRQLPKRDDRKVAESLVALGLLRKEEARLDEAEGLVRQALELERRTLPSNRADIAKALVALGSIEEVRGRYDQARQAYEEALTLPPPNAAPTAETAENLTGLADVNFYQGKYDLAQSENQQALAINHQLFGEKHPSVAQQLNNLGAIAMHHGQYTQAEADYRESLAITKAWYGAEHPETAANQDALAQSLIFQKKYDEAEVLLGQALAIQEQVHGRKHPAVALALNELGSLAFSRDQDDAALTRFQEAADIWRAVYGENHQFMGVAYSNLGSVYLDRKDFPRAEEMFRRALARFAVALPDENMNSAIAHLKLGRTLLRQKRFADAEPETLHAYHYLVKQVDSTNGYFVGARKDLNAIYLGLK